jgi:hypothetical protein
MCGDIEIDDGGEQMLEMWPPFFLNTSPKSKNTYSSKPRTPDSRIKAAIGSKLKLNALSRRPDKNVSAAH